MYSNRLFYRFYPLSQRIRSVRVYRNRGCSRKLTLLMDIGGSAPNSEPLKERPLHPIGGRRD